MLTSVQWLNRYLDPANLTADEAVEVLEAGCFPIESVEQVAGDTQLDVELTSNRGDCFSHAHLARDIAAITGRAYKAPLPAGAHGAPKGPSDGAVENTVTDRCPRFTARRITGVTVGPSPEWLRKLLEAVGQRPINNIVDISNFALFELGHPSHCFDMGTLAGGGLVVRHARAGETLRVLDGTEHRLVETDLVVADAEKPVSLAGVVGGLATGVTEKTTDVLLEVATWDPTTIRDTARRLDIRTDAGYRFERTVAPHDLARVNEYIAQMIVDIAGGTPEGDLSDAGVAPAPLREVPLRAPRVEHILGIEVPANEIARLMTAIGITVSGADGDFTCTVPPERPDLTREIDLIEEVARLHGIDKMPVSPRVNVPLDVEHPERWQRREGAEAAIADTLCGLGFYEAVTFSFLNEVEAAAFLPSGLRLVKIDEERRKDAPFLRPSIVPSLLHCRKANRDARVRVEGGVRLFELGAVVAEEDDGTAHARTTVERRHVGIILDAGTKQEQQQTAVRTMRAAIDAIVERLAGAGHAPVVAPADAIFPILKGAQSATVTIDDQLAGYLALLTMKGASMFGLDEPCVVCELALPALIDLYPPRSRASRLPAFPEIQRDLSLVLDESVAWREVETRLAGMDLDRCVGHEFVGTFRGKQVGAGKKSVTFRLRFRDDERTLRHEEVDPQVASVVGVMTEQLGAELRA
ncbi:MAG: phenylalanine--tRNA ligase subunit beta [Planctomycetota bacterium]